MPPSVYRTLPQHPCPRLPQHACSAGIEPPGACVFRRPVALTRHLRQAASCHSPPQTLTGWHDGRLLLRSMLLLKGRFLPQPARDTDGPARDMPPAASRLSLAAFAAGEEESRPAAALRRPAAALRRTVVRGSLGPRSAP